MQLFLDTAKLEEIRPLCELGVISGVTTNPSLLAKAGRSLEEVVAEIAGLVEGPILGEVKAAAVDRTTMVEQGRAIAALHPRIAVKIPLTAQGLAATSRLSREGIAVANTLVFSPAQALLSVQAGAKYVAPFVGRLDDIGESGLELVRTIAEMFRIQKSPAKLLVASVRSPLHVVDCALAGADIATVPAGVLKQMVQHPLTDAGILRFQKDESAASGEK